MVFGGVIHTEERPRTSQMKDGTNAILKSSWNMPRVSPAMYQSLEQDIVEQFIDMETL